MAQQHVAFSPIRNPANPDRVFIYRVAPTEHTLSYEQRAIHKGISAPRWNKNPSATDGVASTILRGDSNVVTLSFDDVVRHVPSKIQEQGSNERNINDLLALRFTFTACAQARTW